MFRIAHLRTESYGKDVRVRAFGPANRPHPATMGMIVAVGSFGGWSAGEEPLANVPLSSPGFP